MRLAPTGESWALGPHSCDQMHVRDRKAAEPAQDGGHHSRTTAARGLKVKQPGSSRSQSPSTRLRVQGWQTGSWMGRQDQARDFPGGPVVKNPPSKARDAGSIPGRGTKIPQTAGQLSPRASTREREARLPQQDPTCRNEDPTCCN